MSSYKVFISRTAPPNICVECSEGVRNKYSNDGIHYLSFFPMQDFLYKQEFCNLYGL